jgi:hypothetical protein
VCRRFQLRRAEEGVQGVLLAVVQL